MLDGECAPVIKAHEAFKKALSEGKDPSKPLGKLVEAILDHETELRAFAGI